MTTLSAHVLDTVLGHPATDLAITLTGPEATTAILRTDADGRVSLDGEIGPGRHTLTLETGPWFAAQERATLFPLVAVTFEVDAGEARYHLAVLLGPFSYTAYRGS